MVIFGFSGLAPRRANGSTLGSSSLKLNAGAFGTQATGGYMLSDFTGDAKADLFFIGNGGDAYVRTSTGTGLSAQVNYPNFGSMATGFFH